MNINNLNNDQAKRLYTISKLTIDLCRKVLRIIDNNRPCPESNHIHNVINILNNYKTQLAHQYPAIRRMQRPTVQQLLNIVNVFVQDLRGQEPNLTAHIGTAIRDIIRNQPVTNNYMRAFDNCKWHPDQYLAPVAQDEQAALRNSNYEFRWTCNGHDFHLPNDNEWPRLKQQQCRYRAPDRHGNMVRCRRTTIIGLGMCWQHLRKWYKLMIAPAQDVHGNNIGKGVYPYGDQNELVFQNHDVIARYDGERITANEMDRRYSRDNNCTATYGIGSIPGLVGPMDGALYRGVGSMINHGDANVANGDFANVRKHNNNYWTHGIIANKNIRASGAKTIGQLMALPRNQRHEILVDYGNGYGMNQDYETVRVRH